MRCIESGSRLHNQNNVANLKGKKQISSKSAPDATVEFGEKVKIRVFQLIQENLRIEAGFEVNIEKVILFGAEKCDVALRITSLSREF